ncbi:polysaccharide lyase family 4 protein [Peniophora sp. CONT]|nr:polysaccharide lyase family 4 protein [Peniophora sp. CONT]
MLSSFSRLATTLVVYASVALAAFGVTTPSSGRLQVDSGSGLVVQINTANGDVVSILYNGAQLQDSSKFTQIASGFGSATVSSSVSNNIAVISVSSSAIGGNIIQYYIVRSGVNNLYMATYADAEPTVGELRLIARLSRSTVPNSMTGADMKGGTAIEGSDVYLVNGQTRSKFYSSIRHIQDQVHTVTGSGVSVSMVIPGTGYERSSGGPFFRDINNQGSDQQELYFYMNSNHEQTESYRTGLFGPYAMVFTTGSTPSGTLDTSFMDSLGLKGYVASSGRGKVTGSYSGVLSGQAVTIGFANSAAQYWASGSGGSFTSPAMIPGTYTATLFQGELAVATGSVSVSAGGSSSLTLKSALSQPSTIWSIGTVDGTPSGFLNADKIEHMHPSDSRMSSWGPITYTIGSSSASQFPMAQFKSVNSPTTINWSASSSQIGARTLRIRTTEAFAGGRPSINVNSWSSSTPAAPTAIDSRGVTRGTWRGLNQVYDFAIPSGTLVAGSNTIKINVVSGSSGDTFLSPNFVFDSVELF